MLKTVILNIFNKTITNINDDTCWLKTLEFVIFQLIIISVLTYLSLPLDDPLWFALQGCITWLTASYGFILLFSPRNKEKLYLVIATAIIILVHWAIGLCLYFNIAITPVSDTLYTAAYCLNILLLSFIFFRGAIVVPNIKSKIITGVILILIGIAMIPLSFNIHGILIEFFPKTYIPEIISCILLSLLILPFVGLFLLSDSLNFKNWDERIKFILLMIIITIMELFLLVIGFSVLTDIFKFHIMSLPVTIFAWIFIIGLSIYKLEYSFDQNYLSIIKFLITFLSTLIGIIILFLLGVLLISSFIL